MFQERARLWAQDWRTPIGTRKYTIHVNRDDVESYRKAYNAGKQANIHIIPLGSPRQILRPKKLVETIHDHGYGLMVDRRPE